MDSQTPAPVVTPAPPRVYDPATIRTYGAYLLTGIVCVLFAASLVLVFLKDDPTLLNMMIGVIAAKFSDIVSYWTGSSASSAQKDQERAAAHVPV